MRPIHSTQHARFEREQLEFSIDRFLRDQGWSTITVSPGAFICWRKEIRGQVMTCGRSLAFSMEESIEYERCECTESGVSIGCPVHDWEKAQ